MKIRNKQTGRIHEVLEGTLFPEEIFERVTDDEIKVGEPTVEAEIEKEPATTEESSVTEPEVEQPEQEPATVDKLSTTEPEVEQPESKPTPKIVKTIVKTTEKSTKKGTKQNGGTKGK